MFVEKCAEREKYAHRTRVLNFHYQGRRSEELLTKTIFVPLLSPTLLCFTECKRVTHTKKIALYEEVKKNYSQKYLLCHHTLYQSLHSFDTCRITQQSILPHIRNKGITHISEDSSSTCFRICLLSIFFQALFILETLCATRHRYVNRSNCFFFTFCVKSLSLCLRRRQKHSSLYLLFAVTIKESEKALIFAHHKMTHSTPLSSLSTLYFPTFVD